MKLKNISSFLLYLLPPVLFFSYFPVITIFSSDSMNLELSLPLIWLIIFDLVSVARLVELAIKHGFGKTLRGLSDRKFFILSFFPLYVTLSALWSANLPRALLTSALIWAIFIAAFSIYQLFVSRTLRFTDFWPKFRYILIRFTTLICIFCWLQCALDLIGLSNSETLLCTGCTYRSFGFPHPSGFAIEPQFMGNLLLFPCILLLVDVIKNRHLIAIFRASFFLSTLFLTFSRGAIYALCIAFIIIVVASIIERKSPKPLLAILLFVFSFVFTLIAQGAMAEISPTNDTFSSGVAKSIHHLSLGVIDLRTPNHNPTLVEKPVENSVEKTGKDEIESSFSGYVEESTDVRLSLSSSALAIWRSSPSSIIFGTGLGSAGTRLSQTFRDSFPSPKEIVQNQYISLLLETGILGYLCLVPSVFIIFAKFRRIKSNKSDKTIFLALSVAYAVSLCFFAGLPNALHIYLLLPLLLTKIML